MTKEYRTRLQYLLGRLRPSETHERDKVVYDLQTHAEQLTNRPMQHVVGEQDELSELVDLLIKSSSKIE